MKKLAFAIMFLGAAACSSGGGTGGTGGTGSGGNAGGSGGTGGSNGANCGNGTIDIGEACDGASLAGLDCTDAFGAGATGTLACATNCTGFDTSGCTGGTATVCGDSTIEGLEDCDGTNLGGATCATEGYASGTLVCSACAFDYSSCVPLATACSNSALTRCAGDLRQQCNGTAWVTHATDDCVSNGTTCAELGAGVATCEVPAVPAALGEACDFGVTATCETGLVCVRATSTESYCLTDCAADATVCDVAEYCEPNWFIDEGFTAYVPVCYPKSELWGACLPGAPADACPTGQLCLITPIWHDISPDPANFQPFGAFGCRDTCLGDDIGTNGGCPVDATAGQTTCLPDATNLFFGGLDFGVTVTCDTTGVDDCGTTAGAGYICMTVGDGMGGVIDGCVLTCSAAADTCATDMGGLNFRCETFQVDQAGTTADYCAQPFGICGLQVDPVANTFASVDAAANCNDWNTGATGWTPPNMCGPLAGTYAGALPPAETTCAETFYGALFIGGIDCASDAECGGTVGSCVDVSSAPGLQGTCSCSTNADCPGSDWCHPQGVCIYGCADDLDCVPSGLICVDYGAGQQACSYTNSLCVAWCESADGAETFECPTGMTCAPHTIEESDAQGNPVAGTRDLFVFGNDGVVVEMNTAVTPPDLLYCPNGTECDTVGGFACEQVPDGQGGTIAICIKARSICSP